MFSGVVLTNNAGRTDGRREEIEVGDPTEFTNHSLDFSFYTTDYRHVWILCAANNTHMHVNV